MHRSEAQMLVHQPEFITTKRLEKRLRYYIFADYVHRSEPKPAGFLCVQTDDGT